VSQNATSGDRKIMRQVIRGFLEMIKICGMLVFLIGFISLVGYIAGKTILFSWTQPPMAINTSIAFVLTGIGLFLSGLKLERYNG
jgi:hypothetical protein